MEKYWIYEIILTFVRFCKKAQLHYIPLFQVTFPDGTAASKWATLPSLYADGTLNGIVEGTSVNADPTAMTVVSAIALTVNVIALGYIIYQAKKRHINPYKEEVFVNQKYYKDAAARIA